MRNYIRRLKNGEIDSNLDDYRAMPEDNTWQGNIFPSNPGVKPEVDHVTKALGKFAFDFLVGDVVTILDPEALTEDKLIAAAMMLPPAKVVKLAAKLKDLEKMKDTIDNLDDVSDKVKDSSDNLIEPSKNPNTVWDYINATQPAYEGTSLPKSFNTQVEGQEFWVNPNGTKHMLEYITSDGKNIGTFATSVSSQEMLT